MFQAPGVQADEEAIKTKSERRGVMSNEQEIERLREHLKVIEHYEPRMYALAAAKAEIENKIAEIEKAAADPWQRAKERLQYWAQNNEIPDVERDADDCVAVAEYAGHLTAENARLEKRVAELEQNSVWGIHSQVDGHLIKAFLTREEAEEELEKDTSKPRFKEVHVSDAKKIAKALNESQKYESMFRVERDKAWKRVKELEADIADWKKAANHRNILANHCLVKPCDLQAALEVELAWRYEVKARVKELEAEPEFTPAILRRAEEIVIGDVILAGNRIQTVTEIDDNHSMRRIIKCDGWMAWFYNGDLIAVLPNPLVEAKTVADMVPPFEGPDDDDSKCREIVRRLASWGGGNPEDGIAPRGSIFELANDAAKLWAEMKGAGDA